MTGAGPAMGVARHRVGTRRAGGRKRSLLRVRDWRVRTKLGAVLAIPAVAFLVVAVLQAGLSVRQAAALDEFAAQVALGDPVTALVHELQFERDWVSGLLAEAAAGPAADRDREQLAESASQARAAVAAARVAFDASVSTVRPDSELAGTVAQAVAALDGLATVHTGLAQGWLREQAVFDGYTRAIEAVLALLPAPLAVEGAEVRGYPELAEAKELTARIRGRLHALTSAGDLQPSESARLADLRAQRRVALDRFRVAATPEQLGRFDEVMRGQAVRATDRLEQAALEQAGTGGAEVTPQQWWSAATTELELFREVEAALLADVDRQVERAAQDRWRQTVAVGGVALLILFGSLLLSVVIGRSMVQSLRLLRGQAVDVAQVRLPGLLERLRTVRASDPVTEPAVPRMPSGADEVGEVADAFTQVHRSAVRLAVEQAQMRRNVNRIFVNLARRSQLLVERQLEVLDELEREEADPTQLRNLFRLDHLATRMRRNNDSLLVLADSDPARRYDQPVLLASVTRAAIAEIERYQRVREEVTPELRVAGYVVADLAHLLAELLDNATAFSEPGSTVMLTGRRLHAPAGALVEIVDTGIGMSPAALQEADQLLAAPPLVDVATSQRMGLVVVSHLAARHGMRVRLAAAPVGVRATVWLPARLLADAPPPAELPPTGGARDAAPVIPRPRRTPVRAEDVLGEARPTGEPGSIWWSRPVDRRTGAVPAAGPTAARRALPTGPTAPVTTNRTSASGLPIRVPLAQLPPVTTTPASPPVDPGLDPAEVGGTLSAFYRGVRQAETEATDGTGDRVAAQEISAQEIDLVPGGSSWS